MIQKAVFFSSLIIMLYVMVFGASVKAQVRQSPNYQIQSDSINVGGGLGTSANYTLESTAGEVATGESSSDNFRLKAGYQQMQEVYIALSGATDLTLGPSIPGITGGQSNGSTTVTVITDSTAGYQLTIESADNPAMQSGNDFIADYLPEGLDPDYDFNFSATEAVFGYSPKGVDVVSRFLDNGSNACATGNNNTADACWDGLSSTTAEVIAQGSGPNHPEGATTTINFRVGVGGSVGQTLGVYVATTTVTALAL